MTEEQSEPNQRWTAKRRVTLVLSIVLGETSYSGGGSRSWTDGGRSRGMARSVSARSRKCVTDAPEV